MARPIAIRLIFCVFNLLTSRHFLINNIIILLLSLVLKSAPLNIGSSGASEHYFCDSIKAPNLLNKYCSAENNKYKTITAASILVFNKQNYDLHSCKIGTSLIIVLFQGSAEQAAKVFLDNLSATMPHAQYMRFLLDDEGVSYNTAEILSVFIANRNNISTVAMFIENRTTVESLLTQVSATPDLNLTGTVHTTEWMIVSTVSQSELILDLQNISNSVDFITIISSCNLAVACIAQKSRSEPLRIRARVLGQVGLNDYITFGSESLSGIHELYIRGNLRKSAMVFLRSKKTLMSGLGVKVAWLDANVTKLATSHQTDNVTVIDGYSGSLLNLISHFLNISFDIIRANDNRYYGSVGEKYNASGIIGLLARREAAFTPLPITRSNNRIRLTDFVPVIIFRDMVHIIYRVAEPAIDIDLIYIRIFQPDFVYIHFGTALVLAGIGALVHVATKSCTSKQPVPLSKFEAKHLLTYQEHICFQGSVTYPVQSGRALIATWSIFWLIVSSAYVAFLTTEFTTKLPEAVINTLQKAAEATDYKIGVTETSSALLEYLQATKNESEKAFWNKLVQQNKTDNGTFDKSIDFHIERVLDGHYVYISGFCVTLGICDNRFSDILAEIRVYPQHFELMSDLTYVATPKDVFYFDDLYKAMLVLEERGLLQHLRDSSFRPKLRTRKESYGINQAKKVVTFSRILLPFYITVSGVGFSCLCLILEVVYTKCRDSLRTMQLEEQSGVMLRR